MKRSILVTVFTICLLGHLKGTHAQFEDLTECLSSETFASQFVECLFAGIAVDVDRSLLPDIDDVVRRPSYDSDEVHGSGRRLQSVQVSGPDRNLDTAPMRYVLDMKLKEMGLNNDGANGVFHDLVSYANAWAAAGGSGDSLAEKLRHFNMKKFVTEQYIQKFSGHFSGVLDTTMFIKNYLHRLDRALVASGQPGITASVCDSIPLDLPDQLCNTLDCLNGYSAAELEDSLDWIQCFVQCDNLAPIAQCSADFFASDPACSRVPWFSDVLVGIVIAAVNKTSCDFVVTSPTNLTQPISLTEGGPSETMSFKSYVPPGVMCIGADPLNNPIPLGLIVVGEVFGFDVQCDVEMQITTANWLDDVVPYLPSSERTKCRVPNRASKQVAIGFHPAATNNSAVFKITEQNWNETFEIPILPVIDHKVDGLATVSFTMKLFVQEEMRGNTVKFPVEVEDTDLGETGQGRFAVINPVECYSLNDPHVMTFDGFYYNNFHHGAFQLYRHDSLPYEVQIITQPCQAGNKNATCNCAVAVRSGDDVFVLDRCKRKCGSGDGSGPCPVEERVVMYKNDELTPGTSVYKMNGGLRHDVVLPHGTIVKIIVSNELLNVWVTPGSYDLNNTMGLCGTYNGDTADDLTMRDGTIYSGPGNAVGEQPQAFSQDWRVPAEELLFEGAPMADGEPFSPLDVCHCTHVVFSGASCECGRDVITELCDLYMVGDYMDNISAILYPSNYSAESANFLSDLALDETFVPPILSGWNGVWNESAAQTFCENLLATTTNEIIEECEPDMYSEAVTFCVQDIQLLDSTEWQSAAIDNAKFRCFNQFARNVGTRASAIRLYPNNSCVNECMGRGTCNDGVCVCTDGYWGADCSVAPGSQVTLTNKDTQLCDTRVQMCNFATIFGNNFADPVDMRCLVKNVSISSEGVDYLPKRKTSSFELDMEFINPNQAICPLPGNGSYEVSVAWRLPETEAVPQAAASHNVMGRFKRDLTSQEVTNDGTTVTFIFISYDSQCFECDATSQACYRKQTDDYCWINNECWAPGETKPNDTCRYCDVAVSTSDWTMLDTEPCVAQKQDEDKQAEDDRKDMILRGALGGSICAVVVIVVIIIFCVTRNKDKKARMSEVVQDGDTVIPRPGTVTYGDGSYKTDPGYENLALDKDDDTTTTVGSYDVMKANGFGESVKQPLTRVDVLKREDVSVGRRHNSLSGASIRSEDSRRSVTSDSLKTAF